MHIGLVIEKKKMDSSKVTPWEYLSDEKKDAEIKPHETKAQSGSSFLLELVCVLLSAITLPIITLILLLFAVYRQIVYFIVKTKLKSKFGGLMSGSDAFWCIEDQSKGIINILMILQTDQNKDEFYAKIKVSIYESLFKNPEHFPKWLALREKALGYFYFIKNGVTVDDCVTRLKFLPGVDELSKEDLMKIVSEFCNKPLPKNHRASAEILIGTQPVAWNGLLNNENLKCYPILFRVHHSLGDGTYMLRILMTITNKGYFKLAMQSVIQNTDVIEKVSERKSPDFFGERGLKYQLKIYAKSLRNIFSSPLLVYKQFIGKPVIPNTLHGPRLTGEKILVMKVEETPYGIEAIKRVKSKIPDTKFAEILLVTVSEGFKKFFQKHSDSPPEFVLVAMPTTHDLSLRVSSFNQGFSAGNHLSAMTLSLNTNQKSSFMDSLRKIKQERRELEEFHIEQINYWMLNLISNFLPTPLLKRIVAVPFCTAFVSNLPGPKSMKVFDDYHLKDLMFWVPQRETIGVGLASFSYDGRLQLGLNVDKAIISTAEDAQDILDDIYNYLIVLDNHTKNNN